MAVRPQQPAGCTGSPPLSPARRIRSRHVRNALGDGLQNLHGVMFPMEPTRHITPGAWRADSPADQTRSLAERNRGTAGTPSCPYFTGFTSILSAREAARILRRFHGDSEPLLHQIPSAPTPFRVRESRDGCRDVSIRPPMRRGQGPFPFAAPALGSHGSE
jgi:hypothetical protein